MIDISIITTVFNKEKYLPNTLRSYQQLTDNFAKEFIFVDDKSSDNCGQLLENFKRDSGAQNIKIIRNPENYGPSKSTNIGIAAASGRHIIIIDGDDMLASNGLTVIMKIMQAEQADLLDFIAKPMPPEQMIEISNYMMPETPKYNVYKNPVEIFYQLSPGGSHYFIKRELLEKVGKICDERIFVQDFALSANVVTHSKKLIYFQEAALLYAEKTNNSLSSQRTQFHHDYAYNFYLLVAENRFPNRRAYYNIGKKVLKKYMKLCQSENDFKQAKQYKRLAKLIKYLPRKLMLKHFENVYLAYQKRVNIRLMNSQAA